MTTFYSDQFRSDGTPIARKQLHAGLYQVTARYTVAAALTADDIVKMVPVAKGNRVKEVILAITDLDTGTSLVLDVGDGDGTPNTARYIDGTTTSSITAQVVRMGNVAATAVSGPDYEFAADGTIDVDVQTAPETGATAGTIKLIVLMANDDLP